MEVKLDTFPRLLRQHARVRPAHPATREKSLGIWQAWTWADVAAEVRALACGLAAQGFRRGNGLPRRRGKSAETVVACKAAICSARDVWGATGQLRQLSSSSVPVAGSRTRVAP